MNLGWPLIFLIILLIFGLTLFLFRNPFLALMGTVAAIFFPLKFGGITILQFAGALSAFSALAWYALGKRKIRLGRIFLPLLLFGIIILMASLGGLNTGTAFLSLRKFFFNIVFFLLIVNLVDSKNR